MSLASTKRKAHYFVKGRSLCGKAEAVKRSLAQEAADVQATMAKVANEVEFEWLAMDMEIQDCAFTDDQKIAVRNFIDAFV